MAWEEISVSKIGILFSHTISSCCRCGVATAFYAKIGDKKKSKHSRAKTEQLANTVSKCVTSKAGVGLLKSFEWGMSVLWMQTVHVLLLWAPVHVVSRLSKSYFWHFFWAMSGCAGLISWMQHSSAVNRGNARLSALVLVDNPNQSQEFRITLRTPSEHSSLFWNSSICWYFLISLRRTGAQKAPYSIWPASDWHGNAACNCTERTPAVRTEEFPSEPWRDRRPPRPLRAATHHSWGNLTPATSCFLRKWISLGSSFLLLLWQPLLVHCLFIP